MGDTCEWILKHRLAWGLGFLGALALWELLRGRTRSPRLREYGFLLLATAGAILFAIAHDHFTASLSPRYFLAAKGLDRDPRPFRLAVTLLAVRSSSWVGLALGTAFLVANNPSPTRPQVTYAVLLRLMAWPIAAAILAAALGGCLFRFSQLGPRSAAVAYAGIDGAPDFLLVWGVHAGSYLGALVGAILAVTNIVWRRRHRASLGPAVSDTAAQRPR